MLPTIQSAPGASAGRRGTDEWERRESFKGEGGEEEREREAPFKNYYMIHQQLAQHCWSKSHVEGNEAAEGRGDELGDS